MGEIMSKPMPMRSDAAALLEKGRVARSRELQKVEVADVPSTHPVRVIADVYGDLSSRCEPQHLPDFGELVQRMGSEMLHYCLVLNPIAADPFIDFTVLHKGSRIPGIDQNAFERGECYSDQVLPDLVEERLMELASCLALKMSRISVGYSARQSSLHVRVYRGAFPVWDGVIGRHTVALAIAPTYATVLTTRG